MADGLLGPGGVLDPATPVAGLGLLEDVEVPGPLKKGWGAGIAGVRSSLYGAGALLARGAAQVLPGDAAKIATGLETAGLENVAAQNEIAAQQSMSYEDVVNDPTRAGEFAKWALGTAAPSLLLMAAGGGAGALVGRALGATKLGALAGAAAPDVAVEAGAIYPEALKTGVEDPGTRAAVGGLGAGAVDFLTIPTAFRAITAVGKATKAGPGAMVREILTRAPKVGAVEATQELTQTVIERAAAGQSLTSPEAINDYIQSALIGGIAGTAVGGVAGGIHGLTAAPVTAPPPVVESAVVPPAEPAAPEPAPVSALPNYAGETLVTFPDGSTMTGAEAEQKRLDDMIQPIAPEPILPEPWQMTNAGYVKHLEEVGAQNPELPIPGVVQKRGKWQTPDGKIKFGSKAEAITYGLDNQPNKYLTHKYQVEKALLEGKPVPAEVLAEYPDLQPIAPEPQETQVEEATQTEQDQSAATQAAVALEPWQMTVKEYEGKYGKPRKGATSYSGNTQHRNAVATAINRGQPVPAEVLADYPDLQKQAAPVTPPTDLQQLHTAIADVLATKKVSNDTKEKYANHIQKSIDDVTTEAKAVPESYRPNFIKDEVNKRIGFRLDAGVKGDIVDHITREVGTQNSKAATAPTELSAALDKYEGTGEIQTIGDLVNEVNNLIDEGKAPESLQAAVDTFQQEVADDHAMAGRGDMDAAEEAFLNEVRAATKALGSNAALTQDEFVALSPEAQAAAANDYNEGMTERGLKLTARIRELIGDKGVEIRLFRATSGEGVGSYVPRSATGKYKAVISMALNAKDELSIADHEGYHAAEDWVLTTAEQRIVGNAVKVDRPVYKQLMARVRQYDRENKTKLADEVASTPAEARAYAFEFWRRGELQADGPLARVFQKLRAFFNRVANFVKGAGFQSIEDIFTALDRGQYRERQLAQGEGGVELQSGAADQTQSPAFRKWFGDSKVVNPDGSPMVVYHTGLFDETEGDIPLIGKEGFHFGTKAAAESRNYGQEVDNFIRALEVTEDEGRWYWSSGGVDSFDVDSEDGYATEAEAQRAGERVAVEYAEGGDPSREPLPMTEAYLSIKNPLRTPDHGASWVAAVAKAKRLGHDGIVYRNQFEDRGKDSYIVFSPVQIKSVNNIGTYDPNNPDIRFSQAEKWSWYRSALTIAVAGLNTKQASAQGWKDQIKGLVAKGVVKQAEIDAVGLDDYLSLQQGRVTKDQVMAFLGENGVRVEEVVLGTKSGEKLGIVRRTLNANQWEVANDPRHETYATREEAQDAAGYADSTKFASYTVPGGENYKELLLTLPGRGGLRSGKELITSRPTDAEQRAFYSSHFDQPNILAHVRFDERTDAEGKRVLFIHEIQSDWGQKGKKEGFDTTKVLWQVTQRGTSLGHFETEDAAKGVVKINPGATIEKVSRPDLGKVPSAPFVTSTKAWVGLSIKRMIAYAAENGFDKIALVNGDQAAELYDLSKQVSKLSILKHRSGNTELFAWGLDGQQVISGAEITSEKTIESYVGKDMAKKFEELPWSKETPGGAADKIIEGVDLKVGGEGMKAFYDGIVPQVANEVLRKLGGGKVEQVLVEQPLDVSEPERTQYGWTVNINGEPFTIEGSWPRKQAKEQAIKTYRRINQDVALSGKQSAIIITPELAIRVAGGLPLFSKAAAEMNTLMAEGELESIQLSEQAARLIEHAKAPIDIWTRGLGIVKDDIAGGLGRWWTNEVSTPNFISASSKGFKNVYKAFNTYIRWGKILNEQLVREKLPAWYKASDADRKAAFDVMLKRTVEGHTTNSQELADLLATLTAEQKVLYTQARSMIDGVLQRQFDSQKESRKSWYADPAEYEAWLKRRQEQIDDMIDKGYVPLRRYGDYSVAMFMTAPDGKRVKVGLEFFSSQSAANAAAAMYAREIERSGVALKVELGRRSKNERESGVSLEQFLGTLRRQGIDISQAERERLVTAMTSAESLVRTQMMHREGLAGYSTDGMRVLHEFGVNTTNEIAYAKFAPVLDAALDGAEVVADVDSVTSEPVISIGESFGLNEDGIEHNLWKRDGPMSGFLKDRANALADAVLVPNHQGAWATKLRTAGVMYFIGGSISGAAVNAMSVPMLLVPHLSMYTDYIGATTTTMRSWKDSWQYYNILHDMDRMKNPDSDTAATLDAAGINKDMRQAIVAAADHIFDTEIHMMLGISQGSLYSKSRNLQRAAELWMAPFRIAEQTNRLASFMAAYRVATSTDMKRADGSTGKLGGQELFRFASQVVDSTQNNYNVSNRPGIMNNPVGALMFQFKSFPLFIIEAVGLMYKQSPKSAAYMLLGLTAMAGVQGLPFAEELLNLIDVISQRLFNSPFNARRAMRNAIKTASDAIGVADLSDAVMRGLINEITGVGVATRLSSGLLPGTRLGAADTSADKVLSQLAGAPYSMVKDTMSNVGGFVSGVATGDWAKAADAIRAGGPIAARNLVKGAEQLSSGYASDSKGRKVADVTTIDGLLQLTGLSSATVTNMNDHNSIVMQSKAFYTQVSQDMNAQLVKAYRSGDTEKIREIMDFAGKWNRQYPEEPLDVSRATIARALALGNVSLPVRTQMLLGRRLAGLNE